MNICRVYSSSEKECATNSLLKFRSYIKKALRYGRIEFAAGVVRDLMLNAQNQCVNDKKFQENKKCLEKISQIQVHGFSIGAHIAALFGRKIKESTNEVLPILIGILIFTTKKLHSSHLQCVTFKWRLL